MLSYLLKGPCLFSLAALFRMSTSTVPFFTVVMKLAGMGLLTVFSILRVTVICEETI